MQTNDIRLHANRARTIALVVAGAGVVLFSGTCIAKDAKVTENANRTVTAKVNHDVIIDRFAQWDKSCGPAGLPSINIDKQPENGKVFTIKAIHTITRSYTGSMLCKGRKMKGIFVIYAPRAEFMGTDEVAYTVTYHAGTKSQHIQSRTVRVKVVSGKDAPSAQK